MCARCRCWAEAVALWETVRTRPRNRQLYAYVELAKYYEHNARDYANAERMTLDAIKLVSSQAFPALERRKVLPDLQRRLERIWRKQGAAPPA